MKIILLQDVRNIGRKGDVKDVPDGYVRNFLFPNKLAEAAAPAAMKKLEAHKAEVAREDAEIKKHLELLARQLAGTAIQFELSVGEDRSVFGSVNKDSILKALREHGLTAKERVEIHLEHPLKTLGEHLIPVDFKKGIMAKLKIIIKAKS